MRIRACFPPLVGVGTVDPFLNLPFVKRRSRGECGPLRRMNQSRCVLALELEADIKEPAFETSAVHTIVAAFVHGRQGHGAVGRRFVGASMG